MKDPTFKTSEDPDIWHVTEEEQRKMAIFQPYGKGWKMLQFNSGGVDGPKTRRQWVNFLWGYDLWLGPIPVLKTMAFLNITFWIILRA